MAARVLESTEKSWVDAISEDSATPEADVRRILQKYTIRAQTAPPRAKSLVFDSIRLTGTRIESDRDGPFELTWAELGAGIWAVMSDSNLRGKSSILNILDAAIRGEFPRQLKPDMWKWLETVDVRYRIDNVLHRTELKKPAGEDRPGEGRATISRANGDDKWITLYEGDAGDGLKAQTEQLMMNELDFPVIYAHNKINGGHAHSWPLIASTFFLSSSIEPKALFGDLPIDGLPLRLLQLFIGLPWVSTYSAALTAQKQVEQGLVERPNTSGMTAVLTAKLLEVEEQLKEARKVKGGDERATGRDELARLDEQIAADRQRAETARVEFETDRATLTSVAASYDDARRRLRQLEDELSAGYSFRKLNPTCCPACEAKVGQKVAAQSRASEGGTCALCKNDLEVDDTDSDATRVEDAKNLVTDLGNSLQIARAKHQASDKAATNAADAIRRGQAKVRQLQDAISKLPADPELAVAKLEAQAQQLRDLTSSLKAPAEDSSEAQGELKVLNAATEVSKTLMTSMQEDVLKEISDELMVLTKKFGVSHVSSMTLDGAGRLKVRQGGADTFFTKLTMGEKLRIKIAISLAAVEVAKRRGHGRHPGLLIIDSPAAEEVVTKDLEEMLDSVSAAAKDIGGVQIILGTIARPAVEAVVSVNHRLHAKGEDYLF